MSSANRSALESRLFKRRLGDRSLPKPVHSLLPKASALYDQLIDREKKVDFRLLKKQLDIQEASFKTFKVKKPLRIFISHSTCCVDGEWYWTLRIDGRLMMPTAAGITSTRRKFTSFIKSLHVEIAPSIYPTDGFIEWTKVHLSPETDGFEIKRKLPAQSAITPNLNDNSMQVDNQETADESNEKSSKIISLPVKAFIQIDHGCDKFTLSPALQAIVNKRFDSKPQLIMGIWQYVKLHKLQDPEDKRTIRCDDTLKAAFEKDKISFSTLPELIATHLSPLEPLEIDYQITIDQSQSESITTDPMIIDVEVETEDTSRGRLPTILASSAMTKEIGLLDHKISELLMHIHRAGLRFEFLDKFHQDPVSFINQWVVSQGRYLEEVLGPAAGSLADDSVEEGRLSELFSQPWIHDFVATVFE